ncbi:Serine protease trypsin-like protein [Phytophthora megakarya]|uniref:Serine protease trypsin-like protein n=1 Tax=Phytophthora megakarya TaxID=4795 RepID=A0A225WTE9_9STRA|nr:Serine protease trypsin-like protein [Phytophthora megakarya]
MKLSLVILFLSVITTAIRGFSFSELSSDPSVDEENRIFGGSTAEIDKYLYIASLHSNGVKSKRFCSGTLIASDLIMTAGHCLEHPMYDVYVSLGSTNNMGGGSLKAETIHVRQAFRHPLFNLASNFSTVSHDMALLKLERPSKIEPARLSAADDSDNKPGSMAKVLGWGLINNESYSDILQSVDIKLITNKECSKIFAEGKFDTIVDDSVICAGIGDGKDACTGDSGGPLLVNGILVGIVSGGPANCGAFPGTYARVSTALDFINDIIAGKSIGDISKVLTAGPSAHFQSLFGSNEW